jgi:uncharacterized protein YgbK (DUF1537 family)
MKTIVLDDDPTGTQCASNVAVLLDWNTQSIVKALSKAESVYIQTNSRALSEVDAVALATRIKSEGDEASKLLNEPIEYVLRGDSTMRGHVFSETSVFLKPDSSILFLPAYPEVGRTTIDGVHYVLIEGVITPAHKTEFANDPVFSFTSGTIVAFVAEKSDRIGFPVPLDSVRQGADSLAQIFRDAPPGSVIVPDAQTDADIEIIAGAVKLLRNSAAPLLVRSAAPLAALLAGVRSTSLLRGPLMGSQPFSLLLVAGSHTSSATSQLADIQARWGEPVVVNTANALENPHAEAQLAINDIKAQISTTSFGFLTSQRNRRPEDNTLHHGEMVMRAVIATVQGVASLFDVIVAKGGITSAEVARAGIGAKEAWVLGQILPGISAWKLKNASGREYLYIVVPGNVGNHDTLIKTLEIVGMH